MKVLFFREDLGEPKSAAYRIIRYKIRQKLIPNSRYLYNLSGNEDTFGKAQDETLTNYLAIIRLNEQLLSLLKGRSEAAIVNVSSIVAIVPGQLATYSASKAALHSYTQALRINLERNSNIKVFYL